jgi:hypothetical protein
VTSSIESFADHQASRLTRQAIRHEPRCPPGDPDAPAADKLLQVARSPRKRQHKDAQSRLNTTEANQPVAMASIAVARP